MNELNYNNILRSRIPGTVVAADVDAIMLGTINYNFV